MKQSLLLFTIIFIVACSGFDKELAQKMEQELDQDSRNLPELQKTKTALSDLNKLLLSTPENLKNDPQHGSMYSNIFEKTSSLGMRIGAMSSQYEDLDHKLQNLLAEYKADKIKTNEVQIEYETISPGMKELKEGFKKNEERLAELRGEYDLLMSNWKSKVESK